MEEMKKNRAVFLDRDGTINEEVGYLSDLDRLVIYPCAAAAVKLINESGMKTVVITNQAGVARGYFGEELVREIHDKISTTLARAGAFIDKFYYCPHHPTEGKGIYRTTCTCRKPEPGMLLQAAEELDIDLARSYLIGDTLRDIETAAKVGTKGILVRTGYGGKANDPALNGSGENPANGPGAEPVHVADDILAAVRWIMKDHNR
jgi:D-glycero-D-manno-heptose 1,7-bisphosphate phosphatase